MGRAKQLGAVGILFTMLSGLVTFVFNHFFIDYPSLKAAVNVIDIKQAKEIVLLDEIRQDIRQIRQQQNTMLEILAR